MELIYILHSGFVIRAENFSVLIDYFFDTQGEEHGFVHDVLLKEEKPLYILSSHFHADHFNPDILQWKKEKENIIYIFSKDILKRRKAKAEDAIYLKKGDVYEDQNIFIKAFGSTDVGISFYMCMEGKEIFHAGDLNNWHWKDESTEEEIKQAEKHYFRELACIKEHINQLDLAMFPVDARMGSEYAKGAEQFLEAIPVKLFAPMHFEPHFIKEAQQFRHYVEEKGVRFFTITEKGETIYF